MQFLEIDSFKVSKQPTWKKKVLVKKPQFNNVDPSIKF